jgi:hypothetical protein
MYLKAPELPINDCRMTQAETKEAPYCWASGVLEKRQGGHRLVQPDSNGRLSDLTWLSMCKMRGRTHGFLNMGFSHKMFSNRKGTPDNIFSFF